MTIYISLQSTEYDRKIKLSSSPHSFELTTSNTDIRELSKIQQFINQLMNLQGG